MGVHGDAVGVGLHADGLQADTPHPRSPAGGDQQRVSPQLAAVVQLEHVLLARLAERRSRCRQRELDAVAGEGLAEALTERRGLT